MKKAVLLILFFVGSSLFAKEVTVAFSQFKPPFLIDRNKTGIEIDIFKAALAVKGHTLKVIQFPQKRLLNKNLLLKSKNIDALSSVKKLKDLYIYKDGIVNFENYVIIRKDRNLKINKLSDLKGLAVVAWPNAHKHIGGEFYDLFKKEPFLEYKKKYMETSNQLNQNKMFWLGRVDALLSDKRIFLYYKKSLKNKYRTNKEVEFLSLIPNKNLYFTAFKDKKIANDFQEGLDTIKKDGTYQKIYDKYLR